MFAYNSKMYIIVVVLVIQYVNVKVQVAQLYMK